MIYAIENELMKAEISDMGAELQSIYNKKRASEYLWQGNADYWTGRAYNLFPICGRLTDGKYTYKGKLYEMGLHGFARNSVFAVEEVNPDRITFVLRANEAIKSQYPFDFIFKVCFSLNGSCLKTAYKVTNLSEDDMYFALGGHPGFNVPLTDGEKFEDYYLEFDNITDIKQIINTPVFYTGRTESYSLKEGKILPLDHGLFNEDAIFFTDMSKAVTLKSRCSDASVRVEYPAFRNLGFWHKPQTAAPYVCIEPWTSVPATDGVVDNLETKNQMERLKSGEEFSINFNIIIK